MKQGKRKEHLKKLMFLQHTIIGAIICLGIGFVVTKTLAWENPGLTRGTNQYIDDTFWNQNPTTGDVFDALYSGNTIYTQNMSGYNNSCTKTNVTIISYNGGNQYTLLPEIITGNTILILNSGTYVNTISQMTLSGECIAILGSGKVNFGGTIDTSKAKYSIIDNVTNGNNSFITPLYTTQTGALIQILSNTTTNYILHGDILSGNRTGTIQGQSIGNLFTELQYPNNANIIDITLYDNYNHINHNKRKIIHDNIQPIITAVFSGTTTSITNNGIYNTAIQVEVNDTNFSGLTNNGTPLNGTSFLFNNQGVYTLSATDNAGNATGISFEIDTTPPSITNIQPSSGAIINTSLLTLSWTTQENTTKIKSQKYFVYSGTVLQASGTVQAGITTQTLPNINNGTYKRQIVLEDTAGNITTGEASNIKFTKIPSVFITTPAYEYSTKQYTNTNPIIFLSGNKTFDYTIYLSGTLYKAGTYTTTLQQETISIGSQTGDINIQVSYTTQDNETGTKTMNFFIDKAIPQITLQPLGKRINTTAPINYSRTGSKPDTMIKYYNLLINDSVVYSGTNKYYIKTGLQINGIYIAQVKAFDIAGNVGQSTAETTIVDQTPPNIHNVVNNRFYNTIPYPIISDENNDPIQVIVRKNGTTVVSGTQNSPYVVGLDAGEAVYTITSTDIAGNSTGVTFTIDTTFPSLSLLSPTSGLSISGNNSITFNWTGNDTNFSGFDFSLRSNTYGYYSTGIQTTNRNLTINNLNNGIYYRKVIATDKAGNTTTATTQYFTVSVPLTGQISIGGVIKIGNTQYVNSGRIQIITNINKPTIATISGNIIGEYGSQIINKEIGGGNQITTIQLSAGEGPKDIYVKLQDYIDNNIISSLQNVVVDISGPSKPILTTINNQSYTGSFTLSRPASTDNLAGVKEYVYQIEQNSQIKKTGTGSSSIPIQNMDLGLQGSFIVKVKAVDNLGNQSDRSEGAVFTYTGIPDTSPEGFAFSRKTDAERNETYKSNTITITGLSLSTTVLASIDEGTLFLNGTNVDQKALVKNGDILYIELESSDEYDDVTTSTLTINDKSAIFKIVTKEKGSSSSNDDDDVDLSDDEIEELEDTYESIYSLNDTLKLKFKELLEDKIDELEEDGASEKTIDKLRYIYDRVVEDINETKDTIYNAPNGKSYIIIYQKNNGYTSLSFSSNNKSKYFGTMAEIKAFIDKNNQKTAISYKIDVSRSTANYKAPNGKIYKLFKTTDGQYSSYNMVIPKLFSSLQSLKTHINKNNPKK